MEKNSGSHAEASRNSDVAFLEPAFWRQLAEAGTAEEIAEAWLRLQCQQIQGVIGGAVMLSRTGKFQPVAFWPDESVRTAALERAAEVVVERKAGVVHGKVDKIIAYPVMVDDEMVGATILDVGTLTNDQARFRMRQLQWGIGWLRDKIRSERLAERDASLQQTRNALSLQATALVAEGFDGACRAVVTQLAADLKAERVSLGMRWNGRTKVVAISHSAGFGRKMNLVKLLAAAMDESIDQRSAVLLPTPDSGPVLSTRTHKRLAAATNAPNVLTVPLLAHDHMFGAVLLERPTGEPFDQPDLDLADGSVALLGPVLETKRAEDRWIITKFFHVIGRHMQRLFGPRHLRRKIAGLAAIAVGIFFWFTTAPYSVPADARLEGAIQRAIVAQFDGFIREAPFSAGDRVDEGDLMVAFDDRELALERLRWSTERQRQTIEYEREIANRDRAATQVARTQIEQSDAQIRLVDKRIERSNLYAPFSGIVVSGDLSQRIGSGATRGEVLFEIAPEDDYRVILLVDERRIGNVSVGSRGALVLTSVPGAVYDIEVTKITPIAMPVDGRNSFRVEAMLDDTALSLHPGMEGVAKIAVEDRRLIWIWTRPLVDWARLKLWQWWPDV